MKGLLDATVQLNVMLSLRLFPEIRVWYVFPVLSPEKLYLSRIFSFCPLPTTSYLVFSSGAIHTSGCF